MSAQLSPLEIQERATISDKERTFLTGSRQTKVCVILLVSMTVGAIVLMALGNNPPSAGAFCLSRYYSLDPVEKTIMSRAAQSSGRWNYIEIYYSGTKAGNIGQLASLSGLADSKDINCHFVVCNGLGGGNGQIQTTEKWQRQWSVIPGRAWHGNGQTIRICVIADGKTARPTDFQIQSIEALVEALDRKYDILPESICYPSDWW
ncbi:MAG: peptidoglycan recognition protein family protein [Planctomycetota bacterium]|jgi:hypothetical protein